MGNKPPEDLEFEAHDFKMMQSDDQVTVTQEASVVNEGLKQQLNDNGTLPNGNLNVPGTSLQVSADAAATGIQNASVLTSTTQAGGVAMIPVKTKSGNTYYRTKRVMAE